MSVIFITNYSFSERRRTHQQRGALGDRLYKFQDQTGSIFLMCS
jgi:hypothetical protein